MASTSEPKIYSFKADGAISKGMVVKAGSDLKHVAKSVLATSKNIGVAQNDALAAEDGVEVALNGGGAKGLAGGTISFGDYLTADSAGKLVATTTANDQVVGQAMQDAVVGDLFAMEVVTFNY